MSFSREIFTRMNAEIMRQVTDAEIGNSNHLDTFINLRAQRALLQQNLDLIKSYEEDNSHLLIDEMSNYPEGYRNKIFELRSGRTTFDFKAIPEWDEANSRKSEIEAKYKTMYQAVQKGFDHSRVDPDTGELLPMPTVKYGKSSIVLKDKK
jgi:hypothetical protein